MQNGRKFMLDRWMDDPCYGCGIMRLARSEQDTIRKEVAVFQFHKIFVLIAYT
jgi:hypothetical protein